MADSPNFLLGALLANKRQQRDLAALLEDARDQEEQMAQEAFRLGATRDEINAVSGSISVF